jgi:methylthioribose-1-phosphate isomerase
MVKTIEWTDAGVVMIDQRLLPAEESYVTCRTPEEVAEAIRSMVIRGAPAIGIAGAMGLALAVLRARADRLEEEFEAAYRLLASTRPTAVNLFWALDRMKATLDALQGASAEDRRHRLVEEAQRILREDIDANRALGEHGAALIPDGGAVLTHCNAGALATGGWGTALGVIRSAVKQGKRVEVYVDETRPFLQGARLTAWELQRDGIPATLITDNMAGHFLHSGRIQCVIVGADRIAANGDVANKIGTYGVAVLAKENGVPFYVAAPVSTIDLKLSRGEQIPIEQRSPAEITHIGGKRIAPEGVRVENPAFDVTPHRYVTAIITENGIAWPPFEQTIPDLVNASRATVVANTGS